MTYSEAIEFLKEGHCISRSSWDEGKFVCRQNTCTVDYDVIPNMTSLPESAKEELKKRNSSITYKDQMIVISSNNLITSWIATPFDTFATDWVCYE